MKKLLLFTAAAAMLAAACSTSAEKEEAATMTVATYNVRLSNHGDSVQGDGWGSRAPHLTDVVKKYGFEIFGTQEGKYHQLQDMLAQLPGYDYIGVGRDDGAKKGEHAAIFYDKNLFEVLDHGDFWLSETPDSVSFGWDAVCRRICTWGKFRHKPTDKVFVYFNLHMDHVGTVARAESAKLILQKIKEFPEPLPAMLSGDFNVDQKSESYLLLNNSGVMKDAFSTADSVDITQGTFNRFNPETHYFTDDNQPRRIDHIFLTPEFDVKDYKVITDTYTSTDTLGNACLRTPSDHYPVRIVVDLNNSASK